MQTHTISIKYTRDNLAEIVNRVAIAEESFLITKFGKAKAMILPLVASKRDDQVERLKMLKSTAGSWSKRFDIRDSLQWSIKLRDRVGNRNV